MGARDHFTRRLAKTITSALAALALVFTVVAPAQAEGPADAQDSVMVDAAEVSTMSVDEVAPPAAEPEPEPVAASAPPAPEPAPEPPVAQAPAPAAEPEASKPADPEPTPSQPAASQPTEAAPAQNAMSQASDPAADADASDLSGDDTLADGAAKDARPMLKWKAVDATGAPFVGHSFAVEGPRFAASADDEGWASAFAAEVIDNEGQVGYEGDDLDPTPGVFAVEQLVSPTDASQTLDIAEDEAYRVRSDETVTGDINDDDTTWHVLDSTIDDDADPQPVTVPEATPDVEERSVTAAENTDDLIAPMAVGPDGAEPPYVYWTTEDVAGDLVGGAKYRLQGPRNNALVFPTWGSSAIIEDCVAGPCTGPDLDPDPGEFLVKQIASHNVRSDRRYRVQQDTAPEGYTFASSSSWVEIPGSGRTPSGWSNGTYDFGDFRVNTVSPLCAAGVVYGISANGQLQRISSGDVTNVGSRASGVSIFNGLGIGVGASAAYAIERTSGSGTSQNATVYTYDPGTGTWSSTGASTSALGGNTGTNMVGGAVDLRTGLYYFGGFTSNGNFKVYQYNPAGNPRITLKGTVVTGLGSSANGDIAFNANGDLFIVHGSGSTSTIYSVTAANMAAATGGNIPSSQSASFTTMRDVNGVAFDSSGRAYLGSGNQVRSYAMPNWSGMTTVVGSNSGLSSTDLASCSSPATITVEKYIQGARVNTNDQFTLTLTQGSQTLGSTTTTGTDIGVQEQRVGPLPTARGVNLTFAETPSGGTNLSNYASAWNCHVDGNHHSTGTGVSGTITIPASGDNVVCRITNTPLVAHVTVAKYVTDANGDDPQPAAGWTLGATGNPTTGSATKTPSADTQVTTASGSVSWQVRFGNASGRAIINVSETQQAGFEFDSGECVVQPISGEPYGVTLTGEASQALPNIAPGDLVSCEYINRPLPKLTLVKTMNNPANGTGYLPGTDWALTAAGADVTLTGSTGAPAVTNQVVPRGTYSLSEAFTGNQSMAGAYTWTKLECVNNADSSVVYTGLTQDGVVTEAILELTAGIDVTCTFTNTPKLGTVSWTKVNPQGAHLAGSEWSLTGAGTDGATVTVTDCVEPHDSFCLDHDTDSRAGYLSVAGLVWGTYTLTETSAPGGFVLDSTPYTFTISGASLTGTLDGADDNVITNEPWDGLTIPLTGGLLSRDFYQYMGMSILILGAAAVAGALIIRNRRKEVA